MRLLLVEDDRDLAANLIDYLELQHHQVDYAQNIHSAETLLLEDTPELLVLDRMLPDGDSLTLLKKLRRRQLANGVHGCSVAQLPVLFLTARDTEADKLAGFAAGADDYLVKPFSLAELGARIKAIGRRVLESNTDNQLCVGSLVLVEHRMTILHKDLPLLLPPLQYRLLAALINAYPESVAKETLYPLLWPDEPASSNRFKVQLHGLRKHLEHIEDAQVVTERGVGARLILC